MWLWLLEFSYDMKSWSSPLFNKTLHIRRKTGNRYIQDVLPLEHTAGHASHNNLVVYSVLFKDFPDTSLILE